MKKMRKRTSKTYLGLLAIIVTFLISACNSNLGDGATDAEGIDGITEVTIAKIVLDEESDSDSGAAFEDFRAGLEEHLGIPVAAFEGASYVVGIEALRAGTLDVTLVSPFSYLQAKQATDVEIIAETASIGAGSYKTVFITRGDRDDINSLEDLKGKTFAFVDTASTSGFLYPIYHLMTELDLDKDSLLQSDVFFDTVTFSGGHDGSMMGVARGDFDAAAVAYSLLPSLIEAGMIEEDDIKIIDETEEIANPVYIARSDLPDELIEKIRDFYLSYDNEDFFRETMGDPNARFAQGNEDSFIYAESMVEALGVDLGGE